MYPPSVPSSEYRAPLGPCSTASNLAPSASPPSMLPYRGRRRERLALTLDACVNCRSFPQIQAAPL